MKSAGGIYKKTLKGKTVYMRQYRVDGKMVTKSLSEEEAYRFSFESFHEENGSRTSLFDHEFHCRVVYGSALYLLSKTTQKYDKRDSFADFQEFLVAPPSGKVLILYGLRRTGKTTLIMQAIQSLDLKDYVRAAYLKVDESISMNLLCKDLDFLVSAGFRYFFIDEVTLMENFINTASALSDIYGMMARVVLSGTDSLGFPFASSQELYDRHKTIHTSFISFPEWSRLLRNPSFDSYIEHGGTLSKEGIDYNRKIKRGSEEINEYVDSAIVHNIIHSLKNYQGGNHFGPLYPLYESGVLPGIINRIIEDTNHRFALSVIERHFKSHDYGSLKDLLSKRDDPNLRYALANVDEEQLAKALKEALEILDAEERKTPVSQETLDTLQAYLDLLDITKTYDIVHFVTKTIEKRKTFLPLGLRYSQAKELLKLLMEQPSIKELPLAIQTAIQETLLNDVKGRMMEESVLFHCSYLDPKRQYFKLVFPVGEFDMVRLDHENRVADIFEIKHSSTQDPRQARFLLDVEMCKQFEAVYYPILEKTVIYQGSAPNGWGVKYIGIVRFLDTPNQ